MTGYLDGQVERMLQIQAEYDTDGEPCDCSVPHPRWCAWNGACCDECNHDTEWEARVSSPGQDHADG